MGVRGQVPALSSLSLDLVTCAMKAGMVVSQDSQTEGWRASILERGWWGKEKQVKDRWGGGPPGPSHSHQDSSTILCFTHWLPWNASFEQEI